MIQLTNVVGGYPNKLIIQGVNATVKSGEFFALLGPNGSGKTTLFRLVTGQLPLLEGAISIGSKPLHKLSKLEKAKKMAVLTQEVAASFDYTVEEIVQLGRYPHQTGFLKILSKHDKRLVEEAMELTNVTQYRHARFRLLSGGEKQRVLLAKALAQEPEILLLDEPTNHLDIHHTFQMLDQLKQWQRERGLTIFAILHDLNVASLYADRIALLHEGSFLKVGDVHTLRNEEHLKTVYNVQVTTRFHPAVPKPQIVMTPNAVQTTNSQSLHEAYTLVHSNEEFIIRVNEPLRAISSGFSEEGYQWFQSFGWTIKAQEQTYESALTTVSTESIRNASLQRLDGVHIATCFQRDKKALHVIVLVDGDMTEVQLLQAFQIVSEATSCAFYEGQYQQTKRQITIALHRSTNRSLAMDVLSTVVYEAIENTKTQLEKGQVKKW